MKKFAYLWKLIDEYDDVVSWGIDEGVDMFIEGIIPEHTSSIDRDIDEIQCFIDRHYSDKNYRFIYTQVVIDLDKMTVRVAKK